MIGNINSLRRQVKNVACNFTDAQVKVREATSNDPWGPSSSLMSEIADMTYNTMAFAEIMQIVWKRLNDHGKNWRHVYKCLVLLDYLIKVGSEKVAQQCRENIYAIQTLRDFQHIEENKDQGLNVREKAKQLVNLLKDDERLKNERVRALNARQRFAQNGMAIGSDGSTYSFRRSDTYYADDDYEYETTGVSAVEGVSIRPRRNGMRRGISVPNMKSELEECRPGSMGEEELQLQIALALSKEEAEKEDELRKHDDLRLQLAISESRQLEKRLSLDSQMSPSVTGSRNSRNKQTAIDDLLSLQPAFDGRNANDPFATPRGADASALTDPWGAPSSTQYSPNLAIGGGSMAAACDPWSTSAGAESIPGGNTGLFLDSQFSTSTATGVDSLAFGSLSSAVGRAQTVDPWGMDPVRSSLPENNGDVLGALDSGTAISPKNRQTTKTPDHFLGENSALVNLDNLMGAGTKSNAIPGMPPKSTVNNPFANTGSAFGSNNPFAAPPKPTTTLNELRQMSAPQQPASPTNPFL